MDVDELLLHCRDLARLAGWSRDDGRRVAGFEAQIAPRLDGILDDFQKLLERSAGDRSAPAAGGAHLSDLRTALQTWLAGLCSDAGDRDRGVACWRAGTAYAALDLAPARAHWAVSQLRGAIIRAATGGSAPAAALASLEKRIDLDLAILWDAHQCEIARRLQERERAATARRLTGGIAHELRQPLNVVRTSAYYLRNAGDPSSEKSAEHLRRIERHVTLADRVIDTMSAFAKLPGPGAAPVAISQALDEALEANPLPSEIDVDIDCPDGLAPVPADAGQIQVALGNLIRNARDAMPEGGCLSLKVRADDAAVAISIADTGTGIPASELGRVTEALYTTKARGMGLGLALTRAIIESHAGELRVVSEPGRGTTFTVTLPRVAAPTEEEASRS